MTIDYPEFVDNDQFIQMHSSMRESEQLRAMLNNLTRVHQLTARKFDNFDDLIREYLVCGCEIFGLETGIVSRVDDEETYHVLDVVSPLDVLHKGQEFPLNDTYCREVIKTNTVLGFPEIAKLDYMNCHPVYINLKLEAYLSAPIYVDNQLFGTLNFTSTRARAFGFSKNEHNLILLMANSIGNYILLRKKNERLEELNDRIMKFVGFVAHDLRNPIGGILALSKLMLRKLDNREKLESLMPKIIQGADNALELVNTILDTAAISTGKVTVELQPTELTALVENAVNSIMDFAKENNSNFTVNITEVFTVTCDAKRIQQALVNLLINAIKYSPVNSNIVITATPTESGVQLEIQNPIAEFELADGNLKSIYDSIGFGLEIVDTILSAHNSKLVVAKDNNLFSAQFVLLSEL